MRNWLRISKLAFLGILRMFTGPGLTLELSNLVTDLRVSEILTDFFQDLAGIFFFLLSLNGIFKYFTQMYFSLKM